MKYLVTGYATMSIYVEVEAKNKEGAKVKAMEMAMPSLCHQCVGEEVDGCWASNGYDDLPEDGVQEVAAVGKTMNHD